MSLFLRTMGPYCKIERCIWALHFVGTYAFGLHGMEKGILHRGDEDLLFLMHVQVNFNTEIWIAAPVIWRVEGKEHVVLIITLNEGPLRLDYDAFFPGKTITTGELQRPQARV